MSATVHWLVVPLVLFVAAPLSAQTALRWKLSPDERLSVVVEQQTTSAVSAVGRTTTTQIDLTMTLEWQVTAVEGERITLQQSLQRVQFHMDSPNLGRVTYDSALRAQPIGRARDVAEALAPLLASKVEIAMNDRGQVLETRPIGEEAADAKAGERESASGATVLNRERIEQLLKQPLALLPERPVDPGDTWQRESQMNTAVGEARQTTTYTYVGPVTRQEGDRDDLHRIDTKSVLTLPMPPAPGAGLAVKKHEHSGTILFSAEQGRLVSAEQTQTLTTERPYRDTTIGVTLTSKQTTRVAPPEAPMQDMPLLP